MPNFRIAHAACCGVLELADISTLPTPEEVIKAFSRSVSVGSQMPTKSFVYFTGVVGERKRIYDAITHANRSDDYGQALADYIVAEKLGTITTTGLSRNSNGNMLRMWIWAPDWEALTAWYAQRASVAVPQQPTIINAPAPPNVDDGNAA